MRLPHINTTRVLRFLRKWIILLLTLALLAAAVLAALADIAGPILRGSSPSRVADFFVTLGAFAAIIGTAISVSIFRFLLYRKNKASIPRGYLPIRSSDAPKAAHQLIQNEMQRSCSIAVVSQPLQSSDNLLVPSQYRRAILDTAAALQNLIDVRMTAERQSHSDKSINRSRTGRMSPMRDVLERSEATRPLLPVDDLYEDLLRQARYGTKEPTKQNYEEAVRIVAIFVGLLGS